MAFVKLWTCKWIKDVELKFWRTLFKVAVSMYVTDAFTNYKSGVYYEEECPEEKMNHAVVIVGYGTDPKLGKFWIVRNSWGFSWGEMGSLIFFFNFHHKKEKENWNIICITDFRTCENGEKRQLMRFAKLRDASLRHNSLKLQAKKLKPLTSFAKKLKKTFKNKQIKLSKLKKLWNVTKRKWKITWELFLEKQSWNNFIFGAFTISKLSNKEIIHFLYIQV